VQEYDPGYVAEPFKGLVERFPGADVYPQDSFRTEWGPVFHRGRLDGTARVLVIGQDPAQHETILRRILVGEAGTRLQGFLAKLGIDKSYVLLNTFLYSVYGQSGGTKHKHDPAIVDYRNAWLDAVAVGSRVEAIVTLGDLAEDAYQAWKATAAGTHASLPQVHITHPTRPESASKGDKAKLAEETKKMLENWNAGLSAIAPAIKHPDAVRAHVPYGSDFAPGEKVPIPARDLPAGTPAWMFTKDGWAAPHGRHARRQASDDRGHRSQSLLAPRLSACLPRPIGWRSPDASSRWMTTSTSSTMACSTSKATALRRFRRRIVRRPRGSRRSRSQALGGMDALAAAAPPLPFVPLELDPIAMADDSKFIDTIGAQPNLPDYVKRGLAAFF